MTAKIYQLPTSLPGSVNVSPNFKYMVTGDDLETITTAGYLNQIDLQSNPVAVTDVLQVLYDFDINTQVGTYNAFSVSISEGIITLSPEISEGNVILPVIDGHVAKFSGVDGAIADAGFYAANVAITPALPVVSGNLSVYSSTGGDLADSNIPASTVLRRDTSSAMSIPPAALYFYAVTGTEVAGAVTMNGQGGIITTSSLTTAPGGTYTITVSNSLAQGVVNSFIIPTLLSDGTNTAGNAIFLSYAFVAAGQFSITILNANSGALNGTLRIGFWLYR